MILQGEYSDETLARFGARPLDLSRLGSYQNWALKNFHDDKRFTNPDLVMTLELDLTAARRAYDKNFAAPGSTFTAYLCFALIQALKRHECFQYRHVNGDWYILDNPPVFLPVATDGHDRFRDAFLFGTFSMDWNAFRAHYRDVVDQARGLNGFEVGAAEDIFYLPVMIGNLPNLRFTSFTLHQSNRHTGRPTFYFGARYEKDGRLLTPLSVTVDHSNADPQVLDALIRDFLRIAG